MSNSKAKSIPNFSTASPSFNLRLLSNGTGCDYQSAEVICVVLSRELVHRNIKPQLVESALGGANQTSNH